ncbi:MAG TPA: hypothetical protein GXX28_05575, partial [Firmicutes bacterium]|nr:hypothetical protein [Bacillota bacterium]
LTLSVAAGTAFIEGYRVEIDTATNVTCVASSTNYIFLKLTRDASQKVTGASIVAQASSTPPADSVLLATAVAGASSISSTSDKRPMSPAGLLGTSGAGTGAGSGLVADTVDGLHASDLAPAAHVAATGSAHGAATTSVNGFMSAADKAKLDGIQAGAAALTSSTPAAETVGNAGTVGTATAAARADHVHPMPGTATTGAAGFMSAADKAKLDGIASGATNTPLASTAPTTQNYGDAASVGVATTAARADHKHGMPARYVHPATKQCDAAPGSHVGSGGSEHAVATSSVAGFMAAADKAKLDSLQNYVHPSTVQCNALAKTDVVTGTVALSSNDVGASWSGLITHNRGTQYPSVQVLMSISGNQYSAMNGNPCVEFTSSTQCRIGSTSGTGGTYRYIIR